jgi:formate hydrogenlyase subunit 4
MENLIAASIFIIAAPILGGLITGVDRIITARMQNRMGPPLLQPFYDVLKLFKKDSLEVNSFQNFYVLCFLLLIIFTGALFFSGNDLLLVIFALTLASVFFILAGYSTHSPYSFIGAERELIQVMAYEPMVIMAVVGMYMVTKTFNIADIAFSSTPLIVYLPGSFIGFVFVLTIKLRKSPFDLSMSHHAHQEIVRGIITEFSGPALALIEIAHWYENVFLLGLIYLFFGFNPAIGIGAIIIVYFLELLIDNTYSRFRWQLTLKSAWITSLIFGFGNILVIDILQFMKLI